LKIPACREEKLMSLMSDMALPGPWAGTITRFTVGRCWFVGAQVLTFCQV